MKWIMKHKWWLLLNGVALIIFIIVVTQGSTDFEDADTFDSLLVSGKWGIRFFAAFFGDDAAKQLFWLAWGYSVA